MNLECFRCRKVVIEEKTHYGLHKACFKEWFGLDRLQQFSDIAIRSQSQAPLHGQALNSSFFHGKFRKYSSNLGRISHILKVQQAGYPELPATEFLCNQIYEHLKVDIPSYYLIRFPKRQTCFVTKNFMSHLRRATLDHFYHFIRAEIRYDCETLINIIGEKTGRRIEQENFAYLTLVDSLIGNHDRHGRNLGFIRSTKGIYLAPFYDNPSALGIEDNSLLEADLQPKGSIFTKNSEEPTTKDYVQEWRRLGYQEVIGRLQKTCSIEFIERMIKASYISEKRQKALLRLIMKRYEELCSA